MDAVLVLPVAKKKRTSTRKRGRTAESAPSYGSAVNGERFRFIDLFCGIGGFRIGFERAGCRCVWSCDWDKHAQKTYKENFGEEPCGDIHTVPESIFHRSIRLRILPDRIAKARNTSLVVLGCSFAQ